MLASANVSVASFAFSLAWQVYELTDQASCSRRLQEGSAGALGLSVFAPAVWSCRFYCSESSDMSVVV